MASDIAWNPSLWESAGGTVPDGWNLVPFADLLMTPKAIAVGVMYPGEHEQTGIPLIRIGDVQDGGVLGDPQMRISASVHEEYRRTELIGDELLITLVGTPGACVIAEPRMKGWNVARALAVAKLRDPTLRSFVKAVLESAVMKSIVSGMLNTTVQPTLNLKEIKALPIPLPSEISIARSIGAMADALSDRIDICRQTSQVLESMAKAIFRSWFVDFDPVRAKADGRSPDVMESATADLFPAQFAETQTGFIPDGWCLGKLGDVCANPRAQARPGEMPPDTTYIGLEHMPKKSIALDRASTAEGLESGKFWFERDDVLFGKLRPYFHKVGLAPCRGVCSTDILVLRPTAPIWLGFLAMHASSDDLISYTTQLSNGARMPRTSWHDVAAFKVVIPSEGVTRAFNDLVHPLFQRIYANIATAKVLAALKEALLPRLISGKLRLPECQEELREMIA